MNRALSSQPFATLPVLAKANLLLLACLTVVIIVLLFPHWRENPDLSHGYLMPLVFLLLLREARTGPPRYLDSSFRNRLGAFTLFTIGVLALIAGGLYAAALDWTHSLVACTLTLAFAFLLAGSLVAFSTTTTRFVPFNWTGCVAIGLWILSAPIPPGSYTRLTLGLQLAVTENVLRALHLLGVAASRHGNIIDLATTSVGVEEACSGVRSLVSCIFAGFFFSATLVRRTSARATIIAVAGPLAIAMNFMRSLILTLLANSGVNISGAWHDLTGFTVLGITAALLGGLAIFLERSSPHVRTRPPPEQQNSDGEQFPRRDGRAVPDSSPSKPARRSFQLQPLLSVVLVIFVSLAGFFFLNTRPSIRQGVPVPDLAAILPAQSQGWRVETSSDLYQFSHTLKTDHLAQRTYLRSTPHGLDQITIYLAYWRAGQAPVSLVASHTPDACWPGSGWISVAPPHAREVLSVGGRPLAAAEARIFMSGDFPQYVWFWHLYDGRPIAYRDPYSPRELLRIAWRYGFTHDGDQLFVRVSSNAPWSAIAHEPLLAEVFARLRPLGL